MRKDSESTLRASGAWTWVVGKQHLKVFPLESQTEGMVWVEIRLEKGSCSCMAVGIVYINPEPGA